VLLVVHGISALRADTEIGFQRWHVRMGAFGEADEIDRGQPFAAERIGRNRQHGLAGARRVDRKPATEPEERPHRRMTFGLRYADDLMPVAQRQIDRLVQPRVQLADDRPADLGQFADTQVSAADTKQADAHSPETRIGVLLDEFPLFERRNETVHGRCRQRQAAGNVAQTGAFGTGQDVENRRSAIKGLDLAARLGAQARRPAPSAQRHIDIEFAHDLSHASFRKPLRRSSLRRRFLILRHHRDYGTECH
jgi:hypothetical protein